MSKKGEINPRYELARAVAIEMGNETQQNILRLLREFNIVEKEGFSLDMAIECWRWLRTREKFPILQARLTTVLTGSPVYIEQFQFEIVAQRPSVNEPTAYNNYVKRYGKVLKIMKFEYRITGPNAMSKQEMIACGFLDKEEIPASTI